ncbi:MAG: hypothetical protein A2126_02720, partial [Candidatus Woykebacteria bacterium GWB1_45_5]
YISTGDFFRQYQKEHNIPLWEKSAIPDNVEKKTDSEFLEKLKNGKGFVADSHYAGWFTRNLTDVFRILLLCDKNVATERILAREHTHKETPAEIEKRRVQIRQKFKKLYSDDNYEDPKLFHLVINTTYTSSKETIQKAYEEFTKNSSFNPA